MRGINTAVNEISQLVDMEVWDRSEWAYEGPHFLRWYWDVRAPVFEEMNR